MAAPAFKPDPVTEPADATAADRHAVRAATQNADPGELAGDGVAAFEGHASEIDAGGGAGDDQHPLRAMIRLPVPAGADLDFATHGGARLVDPDAGGGGGQQGDEREEHHGRTGNPRDRRKARASGS